MDILGFPSNQFANEEPGSETEVKTFVQERFGVTFDMFSKVKVKGPDKIPLYQWLTGEANPQGPLEVRWNFQKFLINRKGEIVHTYDPKVEPDHPKLLKPLKQLLQESIPQSDNGGKTTDAFNEDRIEI